MLRESIGDEWQRRFGRREPKVICVGRNYLDHVTEGHRPLPQAPVLFAKFATALCRDGDVVAIPAGVGHVDAEAELAVVVGERIHHATPDVAIAAIAGYTCASDVSAREQQEQDGQWFRAKGYDTFCPIGPEIVELDDASDLRVQQRVNGVVLQDARTSSMIFPIAELISYISNVVTIEPGDIVLTGTPAGVGFYREPKVALKDGDLVEIEIECIGILSNEIRELGAGPAQSDRILL